MKQLCIFLVLVIFAFQLEAQVPIMEQVGPDAMPAVIAPIKAPFYIPQFKRPKFPNREISIVEYGAIKGGVFNCRQAINDAIVACSKAGGGKVLVPEGQWLTGRIELKSNVELHLNDGAELHFSGNVADFQPAVFCRIAGVEVMSLGAFIYAYKQNNIAVTGKGKLIGPALDAPIRSYNAGLDMDKYVDFSSPVETRILDGQEGRVYCFPYSLSPIECQNVFIESISIERSAMWNVVPVYCSGVVIRGVKVNSVGIPASDGINIDSSHNVLVEYCSVQSGDDCYCLKAGRNEDGVRVGRSTENVVHRYNEALEGHGGITCGSETAGIIRNIYVTTCRYENVGSGIRFKTRRPRGGGGENLTYEDITIVNAGNIFVWDMLGSPRWVGKLAQRFPALKWTPLTPVYRDITFRSIVGSAKNRIVEAKGITESPIRNVLIEDSELQGKNGVMFRDAREIIFRNCDVNCESEILFDLRNVQHFQTSNCRIDSEGEKTVRVAEISIEDIDLSQLRLSQGETLKLTHVEGASKTAVLLPD